MSAVPALDDPLKGFVLPPMPASLCRVREEKAKPSPDLQRIIDIVSNDVGLAAEVLKTVNSPAFRRSRPLSSIPNAVMMLGVDRVLNIAVAASLRASFGAAGAWMEQFWEVAGDVATSMAILAREVSGILPDTAYTLGLFHDSGIPLLRLRFADYEETLKAAAREGEGTVVEIERARFGLHHALIGAHVSHTWNLDPAITRAIRHHHDYPAISRPDGGVDGEVVTLVGLLKMAEQITNAYRGMAFRNVADDHEWARIGESVLGSFDLTETQYRDLTDAIIDLLSER